MWAVPDAIMPDQKLLVLCRRISAEKDTEKLTAAIDELTKLLNKEQNSIKAIIRERLSKSMGGRF
jgi:hypothetical protein